MRAKETLSMSFPPAQRKCSWESLNHLGVGSRVESACWERAMLLTSPPGTSRLRIGSDVLVGQRYLTELSVRVSTPSRGPSVTEKGNLAETVPLHLGSQLHTDRSLRWRLRSERWDEESGQSGKTDRNKHCPMPMLKGPSQTLQNRYSEGRDWNPRRRLDSVCLTQDVAARPGRALMEADAPLPPLQYCTNFLRRCQSVRRREKGEKTQEE